MKTLIKIALLFAMTSIPACAVDAGEEPAPDDATGESVDQTSAEMKAGCSTHYYDLGGGVTGQATDCNDGWCSLTMCSWDGCTSWREAGRCD